MFYHIKVGYLIKIRCLFSALKKDCLSVDLLTPNNNPVSVEVGGSIINDQSATSLHNRWVLKNIAVL